MAVRTFTKVGIRDASAKSCGETVVRQTADRRSRAQNADAATAEEMTSRGRPPWSEAIQTQIRYQYPLIFNNCDIAERAVADSGVVYRDLKRFTIVNQERIGRLARP